MLLDRKRKTTAAPPPPRRWPATVMFNSASSRQSERQLLPHHYNGLPADTAAPCSPAPGPNAFSSYAALHSLSIRADGPTACSIRSNHGRRSVLAITSANVVMPLTARIIPKRDMSARLGESPPTNFFLPSAAVKSPT